MAGRAHSVLAKVGPRRLVPPLLLLLHHHVVLLPSRLSLPLLARSAAIRVLVLLAMPSVVELEEVQRWGRLIDHDPGVAALLFGPRSGAVLPILFRGEIEYRLAKRSFYPKFEVARRS